MSNQLTPTEINSVQQLLKNYDVPEAGEIESAIATLEKNNGDLEASFNQLWDELTSCTSCEMTIMIGCSPLQILLFPTSDRAMKITTTINLNCLL